MNGNGSLLIRNAQIVDGSGGPAFPGGVLVRGGRIAALTAPAAEAPEGCAVLDAGGRCLTPGFVDIHRHADLVALSPAFGEAELTQGITTCVSGNCGMSAGPCAPGREGALYSFLEPCLGRVPEGFAEGFASFGAYARRLAATPLRLNAGALVGSGTVRIAVKGFEPGPLSPSELDRAKGHIAEAMEEGALGLSFGLLYAPDCYNAADELIALAAEAGRGGGLVATHIRGEGDSLPASVAEVLSIAEQAGVPLHISHFKAASRACWGETFARTIDLIEDARARGQDVTCDVYPYTAGATMLMTLLPPAFLAGGTEAMLERLANGGERRRLKAELARVHDGWDNLALSLGWNSFVVSSAHAGGNRRHVGRSIEDIAASNAADAVDCLCDILLADGGTTGMVLHCMSPADVRRALALPWSMVVSDAIYPPSGLPHPRLWGAFPRVIREYVSGERALSLEQAVRKMSALPAARMGLADRGMVRPGLRADLLLFNPEHVADRATYAAPAQASAGMDLVLVGGAAAVRDGRLTGCRNGHYTGRAGFCDGRL